MYNSQQITNDERDSFIDTIKILLILLVVLGHCGAEKGTVIWYVHQCIYSFHMPFFLFISGFCTKIKSTKQLLSDSIYLFRVFIIFHIIDIILEYLSLFILDGSKDMGNITWYHLLTPRFALWYLLAVIYSRLIIHVLNKIQINVIYKFLGILFLCICSGYIAMERYLGIQKCLAFFPFFYLGFIIKE